MIFVDWHKYRLSRLMVGTVQFGMPYGLANRTGQPDFTQVVEIVRRALDGGVNCFDTASAYGTSEEVLGRALAELGVADRVVVVTKVRALTPDERADGELARQAIEQSVAESRRRLGLDCLPLVLFHREEDAVWFEALERLRDRGWLRRWGVSCGNEPAGAARLVESGRAAALQLPGNLLDRRHLDSGVLDRASASGVAVFLRSVYLQGLLTMPAAEVPRSLRDVLPVRERLAEIARQAGMDLTELALRFGLSQRGVTSLVVGVETLAQLDANLRLFDRGPLEPDTLAAIRDAVPDLAAELITPALWNRQAEIVLAGGCFWCTEAVFEQLDGVLDVVSGYAGGAPNTANYDAVCSGRTGHAEAIRITFDPSRISLDQLLDVFFDAHDPTQLNRQGNDVGTQYRSAIFPIDAAQRRVAEAKIAALTAAGKFGRPIVTTLEPLVEFYPAEAYHQDFVRRNPWQPYVQFHSIPNLCRVRELHGKLFQAES